MINLKKIKKIKNIKIKIKLLILKVRKVEIILKRIYLLKKMKLMKKLIIKNIEIKLLLKVII